MNRPLLPPRQARRSVHRWLLLALVCGAATVQAQSYTFTTLAGTPGQKGSTDGIRGAGGSRFNTPTGVAVDSNGNVYVAELANHTIRKITSGGVVTTLAGTAGAFGSTDATGSAARFNAPIGVAVDGAGNLYIGDYSNQTIRKITSGGVVTTLAGAGGSRGSFDGTGRDARFREPWGVAVDGAGNVYVADSSNRTIRKITSGGVVTTLAGTAGTTGLIDAIGAAARFRDPQGVAVDGTGSIWVVEGVASTLRRVTSGGIVTTLAGNADLLGSGDGTGAAARFNYPTGVAIGGDGSAVVADSSNHSIRRVTNGGVVTTLGGSAGNPGATDGTGTAARFNNPFSVATDSAGNIYVTDSDNQTVRWGATAPPALTSATSATVAAGASFTYTAFWSRTMAQHVTASGLPAGLSFNEATGVISGAPTTGGRFPITLSAINGAGTASAILMLTSVAPPGSPVISLDPASQVVTAGANVTFTTTATGPSALTYQWFKFGAALPGANGRTLTFNAGNDSSAGIYTVAVSNGTGTVTSAGAVLAVIAVTPVITAQPISSMVSAGSSVTLTVVATGPGLTYQWQKNGTAISGATSASFTIPAAQSVDAASYTVVVASGSTSVTSTAAVLGLAPNNPGRLKNLSTLSPLAAGEKLTFGFVVGGAGTTGAKPLLVRAGGPSLSQLGVPNLFADPKLDFFSGTTQVGTSDNWGGDASVLAAQAATGAFPFASATSLDAAIFLSAAPAGNLSAVISGPATSAGNVIAEVYDATPSSAFTTTTPRLINVSVLKSVGTGFTIGFVLTGTTNTQVLIRAVGPTLTTLLNVGGTAPDPKMTLFNGASATIGSNDDWGTPVGTGAATGAQIAAATSKVTFALGAGSKDAAILATLAPGSYTVAVSVTGATGLGLVEVYEIP